MADNEQQPADDLRSLLAGAIDESAANAAAAAETVAPKAEAAAEALATEVEPEAKTGDDRPRDESGKFVKKADKEEQVADKTVASKDEPKAEIKADADDKAAKGAEPKAGDGKEPPANWATSDKAMFKLQSPEAQAFLLKKVSELESGFYKKSNEIADFRKEYEPVAQLFAPHLDVLKQKGLTPHAVIKRWAEVETALAGGRGADIVDGLVRAYNIDKATLARKLGFTSSPSGQGATEPQTQQQGTAEGNDPTAQLLATLEARVAQAFQPQLAKIDQFEAAQRQAAANAAQARESAVENDISTFKSAVNDKGELLHPYFAEVEPAMIALAQSYVASKQPLPKIAELYETAVWANPSTRTAMLATQKVAEQARQAEEARAKAASARKAASSVTGAPGTGQATKPIRGELSLRDQLEEAYGDNAA